MKKKIKSWLIRTLRKWLNKLESGYNTVNVTYTTVPCVTVEVSVAVPKHRPMSEDRINEILAKKLSEDIMQYAYVEQCEKIDISVFDEYIIHRATVKVAADKRD